MATGGREGGEGGGGKHRRGGYVAHVYRADQEGLGDGLYPPADAVDGDCPTAEGRRQLTGNWIARPNLEGTRGSHG